MNYRHVYMLIIEHAKSEEKLGLRKKGNGNYYEKHHILPKSLFPLWVNRKSNLVLLTAREHFFCHQLLIKIYPSRQMYRALSMFMKNCHGKRNLTPKQYESARMASIKANYLTWSDNDYKKKMKQKFKDGAAKRRETYKKHPELLDNMKKINSERTKKSKWYNNGKEEKLCLIAPEGWTIGRLKAVQQSKKYRQKRSVLMTGMKIWNNGLICIRAKECPGPEFKKGFLKKLKS